MPLHVAFLWHMHQPDYVDPSTRRALLPWVRLHATKGYLDMIAMAERFPTLRMTFNLTPVLLRQIEEQGRGEATDLWSDWTAIPAAGLDRDTKLALLEHFFSAPLDTMILPYPRYAELWRRRGSGFAVETAKTMISGWSESDWRDLQVWFNLCWFGYTAEKLYPEIRQWKEKGSNFTEEEKLRVLNLQQTILREVLGRYGRMQEAGRVELTTTPYYHPILPLLINSDFALRAMPAAPMPPPFMFPEDAHEQLARAIAQHRRIFGRAPQGIWPAEGSVAPEILPLIQKQGIQWFATDQEVLFRSQDERRYEALFEPYWVKTGGGEAMAVFREHGLSDYIGFVASRNPAEQAAEGFMGKLREIQKVNGDGLVCVILDGENAWNHFSDGGEAFLQTLYSKLTTTGNVVTTTISNYLEKNPPQKTLSRLHTGSWINADFDIWIGDPEENRAWELLGQARRYWEENRASVSASTAAIARESLLAAEGSDWFWWYGPDFSAAEDLLLDQLFRGHLQFVYRTLGVEPPLLLETPICRAETVRPKVRLPVGYIEPTIDGRITSFYEWQEAGKFEIGREGEAAMARGQRSLGAVYFGFSAKTLYLRMDPLWATINNHELTLRVHFYEPENVVLQLSQIQSGQSPVMTLHSKKVGEARVDQVLEMAVPLSDLGFLADQEAAFTVEIWQGSVEVERYPEHGQIRFILPGEAFALNAWKL